MKKPLKMMKKETVQAGSERHVVYSLSGFNIFLPASVNGRA